MADRVLFLTGPRETACFGLTVGNVREDPNRRLHMPVDWAYRRGGLMDTFTAQRGSGFAMELLLRSLPSCLAIPWLVEGFTAGYGTRGYACALQRRGPYGRCVAARHRLCHRARRSAVALGFHTTGRMLLEVGGAQGLQDLRSPIRLGVGFRSGCPGGQQLL